MRPNRTRSSAWASVAAVGLVVAQLVALASIDTGYLVVAAGAVMAITAFAAFKQSRDACVESRLVIAAVAVASAIGVTLSTTIGLPGAARQPLGPSTLALLATALLVLLAIAIEARARHGAARPRSRYAL